MNLEPDQGIFIDATQPLKLFPRVLAIACIIETTVWWLVICPAERHQSINVTNQSHSLTLGTTEVLHWYVLYLYSVERDQNSDQLNSMSTKFGLIDKLKLKKLPSRNLGTSSTASNYLLVCIGTPHPFFRIP